MGHNVLRNRILGALLTLAIGLSAGHVHADKPSWAGGDGDSGGKHGKKDKDKGGNHDDAYGRDYRFQDDSRRIIADFYGTEARKGNCPPGLAKKNNGCQPPGQAKKWAKGRPLPADLRYYDLPRDLLRRLPPPPPQHRYVQVAGDVLMIAVGSSMVIDAIEDILR